MEQQQILQLLKNIPLFAKTDPLLLRSVLESPGCKLIQASTGEQIGNGNGKELIVLLRGRAQIRSTDGERNVILRIPGPGEVIGAASLFLKQSPPISQVSALGKCTALLMDLSAVRSLLHGDNAFLEQYLAFLAGRVQFLNQKIRCFTAGSADRRLALWLASEEQDTLTLPASLSALAETLDIGRASLYRALDKLEAKGLIHREGREITLLSREKILEIYQ